jgi:tetratricopeptide (TPR) repeat protein
MSIDHLIEEAKILVSKNKLEDAKIVFESILEIEPDHYKTITNIGAIYLSFDELIKAEEKFKKAISIEPEFEIAHYNLGITQKKLNRLDYAKNCFEKAISLKKNYIEAHTNLGTIFLKLEKLNDAESCFKKAIKFDPRFAEAHYNLGITHAKQFKYKDAEISYKNAIKCKSNFQEAENNLKKILIQNKLLLNIERVQKKISNNNNINSGLAENPFISKRSVETELINELYKIDSVDLDKTVDIRYGNGKCSDYELFENNSPVLKKVEKELIKIMSEAVKSEIFIIESFFNILRSGSGLTSHNHINDFDESHRLINKKYSLTYYLSVGDQNCKEPGILKLFDPEIKILPSPGTIVIFPADRQHSATYGGKTDRVMIGINFYSLY